MKRKARIKIRIITGVISLLYFSLPFIIELSGSKPDASPYYSFIFVPEWVYNYFCNLAPSSKHFVPFTGTLFTAIIFWICLYYIFFAIYEIYLDIYLNKKRFKEDVEEE